MTEPVDPQETNSGGLSRRQMLGRGAVAGGIVWATPMIMAGPAGAQTVGSQEPEGGPTPGDPCDGGIYKTLFIKYEPKQTSEFPYGTFTPVSGSNDCLLTEKTDSANYGPIATDDEVKAFIATYFVPTASNPEVVYEGGGTDAADRIKIYLPDHCTVDGIVASAKQGNKKVDGQTVTNCVDGLDGSSSADNWILFDREQDHALSHVEFGIVCCVPTA